MGGNSASGTLNDVWRSTDKGATWSQITANANWSARKGLRAVSAGQNSILMTGGMDGSNTVQNDVWWSTDDGQNWIRLTAHAEWAARYEHTLNMLSDGTLVVMGGSNGATTLNDVWTASAADWSTWTEQTASAPWSIRSGQSTQVLSDNSLLLMGGYPDKHDVWRSTSQGATWVQQTGSASWSGRYLHSSVVMPDGSVVLMGGSGNLNDVWRSTDNGVTWTQLTTGAWSGRNGLSGLALPDGSMVIVGGLKASGYLDDVWRMNPVGSSEQNPTHTFPSGQSGSYGVILQTSNTAGTSQAFNIVTISTTPVSLVIDGYVKDAETAAVLPGATVAVTQGPNTNNVVANAQGLYATTSSTLQIGVPTTIVATADGHETYQTVFTPAYSGELPINLTLMSLTPSNTGTALGGIVRQPPYNRTVDGVTVVIQNLTGYVSPYAYTVTTNSAGFYIADEIQVGGVWYEVWGSKSSYVNSTIYNILIGAPPT
jgi:hypothetical protein